MKAPPFAYARAGSLEEALELLHDAGDEAKLLAGGQSLLPLLAFRVVRPTHLVDIDGLDALAGAVRDDGALRIGSLTRHAALERMELVGAERLLALAASEVGHVPIRARGTLGGSLAHADPASELPVALLALDADVFVRSLDGRRSIPAAAFFLGTYTTALEPHEAIEAVSVPAAARAGTAAFAEFAVRSGDFALASVGITALLTAERAERVRIGIGGVDATAVRAHQAEALLEGAELTDEAIAAAGESAAAGCDPASDPTTSAAYRRRLVNRLVRDALVRLRSSAEAAA